MSKKQIILLAIIALADLCLLSVGAVIVLNGPKASPVVTPVAIVVSPTFTPRPSPSATATPKTPTPTATHWATWTPFPSQTPFPSITPSPTATPSDTPTSTRGPTSTPRSTSTSKPGAPGGGQSPAPGPSSGSVPGRITCGTPNGEPTGGKLSAGWSVIAWQVAPDDPSRVIGTMRILASGGDDCYKFSLLGKNYDYQPIDFRVPKCSSTPTDLIITSRDGQTWKQTFVLDARDPGWNCK